jgi:hypothetical protein
MQTVTYQRNEAPEPLASGPTPLPPELREAFETWARGQNWICDRNGFGEYIHGTARDGWDAYQAADKAATERAARKCEDVDEPGWTGYECPNTFGDGVAACVAAIRASTGEKHHGT